MLLIQFFSKKQKRTVPYNYNFGFWHKDDWSTQLDHDQYHKILGFYAKN